MVPAFVEVTNRRIDVDCKIGTLPPGMSELQTKGLLPFRSLFLLHCLSIVTGGRKWKVLGGLNRLEALTGKTIFQDGPMNKVITLSGSSPLPRTRLNGVRDRRYTIRYPFAADAELIDMETGKQVTGVTSDLSLGGCFVCTSKPMPLNGRCRLRLTRKGQALETLAVVRIVKPRIGLGIEFFDLEPPNDQILSSWIEVLQRKR
jgi:PilZ domain